ncbi:hypothetical protein L1987_37481 [Smallanthus sonchifolius]|uniref:Uncharacterized protein n=1 Tax=Smallanthus sonchifolius TaxID=185202 RepID=A0ACB9HH69_9ASTR|nr:hypothetical protein L1987_37481 [Smallanthus sonchifolius]
MSSGEGRKVTYEDIERVHDLIERCILKYMKKKEAVDVLYQHHNIEPCFTEIIWQQLEKENEKFFRNYYLRLAVKDQIERFNNLLEMQAALMKQLNPNHEVVPPSNQPIIPFDLPPNGHLNNFPFNTSLAQNPNANGSGGVESVSNNPGIQHQLQRTFTDDLSAFLSPHPPDTLFDSN